ncbi:hypothetical protein H6P81_007063 [Aristolochia fimbriata]|uniref:Terpene synthase N-terminal domain-containing protein n=1 Tax=Aristolochia fimbriata TaxID=158543 RepID=A0AAV7F083_ARIFI|nr:hypothetical protein H6P81_007063 [Aristolochia fimbriata]
MLSNVWVWNIYEFEEEIEDALFRIYNTTSIDIDSHGEKHDHLYHEATHFRVLREGGYKASADVFQKYKNEDGKSFKEELTRDVKGLLSLYEAAFLEIRGEDILDEAIAFTTQHLKSSLATNTLRDPLLEKHIQRALEIQPTRDCYGQIQGPVPERDQGSLQVVEGVRISREATLRQRSSGGVLCLDAELSSRTPLLSI